MMCHNRFAPQNNTFFSVFLLSLSSRKNCLTWFGKEVDERVGFAALVQLRQLRATVETKVVYAEASLTANGGVEQSTLGNRGRPDGNWVMTQWQERQTHCKEERWKSTWMKAPVSSLSASSCFSSTVTALSQSSAAISTSVVLFMWIAPKKSVALKPLVGKQEERNSSCRQQ